MKYLAAVVIASCQKFSVTIDEFHTCTAEVPVVPFIGFGSSAGSLRNVLDGAARVDLPSPLLLFGSSTFTTAFVSVFIMVFKL